jgi:hypothetical protein
LTTRKPDLPIDETAARGADSGMDSDPYLVSLARQGRRRFPNAPRKPLADLPAATGEAQEHRDLDPYLVELARNARRKPVDRG